MKKAAIITGYTCNNNCRFCYDESKRRAGIRDLTTQEVSKKLLEARSRGCDYVDFLGGEFTIRKDALGLVKLAREIGFETVSLTTNGRVFSYMDAAKRFVEAGVNSVIFSIHGHNEQLHDFQTRVRGSFRQLIQGIENIRELGLPIYTNTTITKFNYREFPEIAEFLADLGVTNAEFIFVDPTGTTREGFYRIVPRISEAAPYIRKGLDVGIRKNIKHWHIRYVPLCHFRGYEDYVSESQAAFVNEEHLGPEFTNLDVVSSRKDVGRVKALQCGRCDSVGSCEGVWKDYAERYGLDELVPIGPGDSLPEEVKVELTRKCNLDCRFCFNKIHPASRGKEMSTEQVNRVIDNIVASGIKAVRFTGGEPFIRDDLGEILEHAKSRGLYTILNTNGTLVDDGNSAVFSLVDDVLLSLHDIPGSGWVPGLIERIRAENPGITLRACTIATKGNIARLADFFGFVEKQDIDDWFLLRPVPTPADRNPVGRKDIRALVKGISALNKSSGIKAHIANALPFCSYDPLQVSQVCVGGRNDDGHTRMVVDAAGRMKPSYFTDTLLGNALKDPMTKAWNSSYMRDVRALKKSPAKCSGCAYLERCKGGLRYAARFVSGSYDKLDPLAEPDRYSEMLYHP